MSLLKIVIVGLLGLPVSAWQSQNPAYSIAVIDGQGAWNDIQGRVAHQPVIQVRDQNHQPVSGAYVEFDTPSSGAGAVFINGTTHFSVTTNADGIATATGMKNNGVTGAFSITVHVSFEGQSIGETTVKQSNVTRKMADLSKNLQDTTGSYATAAPLSPNVLGIALGDQFVLSGVPTSSNANLFKGTRLQTQATPVTIYLHDKCEFLIGPHSAVTVLDGQVNLERGAIRAKQFGSCKMAYAALHVEGVGPNAGGVISLSGSSIEVASVSGQVRVANTVGEVLSTVDAGSIATFGPAPLASGASAGAPLSVPAYVLIGTGIGGALAGVGLAVDAVLQHTSTSP